MPPNHAVSLYCENLHDSGSYLVKGTVFCDILNHDIRQPLLGYVRVVLQDVLSFFLRPHSGHDIVADSDFVSVVCEGTPAVLTYPRFSRVSRTWAATKPLPPSTSVSVCLGRETKDRPPVSRTLTMIDQLQRRKKQYVYNS